MDSLNTILNSGTYGENVSRHNDNNSKIKQAITTLENVAIANKGYFDTLASLQAAFPSPKAGNIAYVANVASSTGYYIYNVVSGVWTATTTEAPAVGVEISNYAQHGYSSSPKTLKQVDDEVIQLAGGRHPLPFKELTPIKIITSAIIDSTKSVKFDSSYYGIFNVLVYELANLNSLLIDGEMQGTCYDYVVSSTSNAITPVVSGTLHTSSKKNVSAFLKASNYQNNYLFITHHLKLNGLQAYNLELININASSYTGNRLLPVETRAGSYLNTSNTFTAAPNFNVDIYNVSGLRKIFVGGRFTVSTIAYAFTENKGDGTGITPITSVVVDANKYMSEYVDVPDNAQFLYISKFLIETSPSGYGTKTTEKYLNPYVVADKLNYKYNEYPFDAVFENYIITQSAGVFGLTQIDAKFSVKRYVVKDLTQIHLYGYLLGSLFDYVFSSNSLDNGVLSSGRALLSSEGNVFYNTKLNVPVGAKYLYLTINNYLPVPIIAAKETKLIDSEKTSNSKTILGANVLLVPVYGQSLAIGGEAPIITTYSNIRHREHIVNENLSVRVDGTQEVSSFGLGESFFDLNNKNDYDTKIATFAHGVGSTSIVDLKKGTTNYDNLLARITNTYNKSVGYGWVLIVPAVCWVQGEQDRFNTYTSNYKGELAQLAVDLNNDIKAITKQVDDVKIISYQTNCLSLNSDFNENTFDMWSYVPNAQIELIRDNALFSGSCPTYPLRFITSSNGLQIHIDSISQKIMGYYEGIAVSKRLRNLSDKGFTVSTITANGNSVNVTFNVPYPPVVIDKELVKEASNWGFAVINSANQNILQSIDIIENSNFKFELKLNCSTSPVGCKVRYAVNGEINKSGYDLGCRGNIRDSQGNKYTAQILDKEYPLHNWLWQFDMLIN